LLSEYQIREHGYVFDSVAKKYHSVNGQYGTQTFYLGNNLEVNLVDRGMLMGMEILPIEPDDEKELEIITITGDHLWKPNDYKQVNIVETQESRVMYMDVDPATDVAQDKHEQMHVFLNPSCRGYVPDEDETVQPLKPSFDATDNEYWPDSASLHKYHPIKAGHANVAFDEDYYLTNVHNSAMEDFEAIKANTFTSWHRVKFDEIDPQLIQPYLGYRPLHVI
jgi:hypothetical protein